MGGTIWLYQYGLPWLLKRYTKPVWKYPDHTAPEVLLRHHRWATNCVYVCFVCIAGSVSSLMQAMVFGWEGLGMWLLAAYTVGAMLTAVPALILGAWAGEVERECRHRGVPVPERRDLKERVKLHAIAMLFWIAVATASPWLLRILTHE